MPSRRDSTPRTRTSSRRPGASPCGRGPTGVRVDHGIATGQEITPHYDAMLAKLIAHGPTRSAAIAKLCRALDETVLLGPLTNRGTLRDIVDSPAFRDGAVTTDWLDAQPAAPPPTVSPDLLALAALLLVDHGNRWQPARWLAHPLALRAAGTTNRLHAATGDGGWRIEGDGWTRRLRTLSREPGRIVVIEDNAERSAAYAQDGDVLHVQCDGVAATIIDDTYAPPAREEPGAADGMLRAPIAGTVRSVAVAPGDVVAQGDVLAVLEAMKMRMPLAAPVAGIVEAIAADGETVAARAVVARLRLTEKTA